MLIFSIVAIASIFLIVVIAAVATAERKASQGWDKTVQAHSSRWMDAQVVKNDRNHAFNAGRQFGI